MGGVACYTGLLLWRLFCNLDSHAYPVKTYADLGERVFGKWFGHLCSILQTLQLIINVSFYFDRIIPKNINFLIIITVGRNDLFK